MEDYSTRKIALILNLIKDDHALNTVSLYRIRINALNIITADCILLVLVSVKFFPEE